MPEPLLEVAAEREFPVFEVPYEVPFIAVTEAAFTQLVNEQYAVLRRALAAQERLERIVLSERGLDALAGALATLIGAAVLVFDARGELLVQHAFRRPVEPATLEALRGEVRERARRREARAFMPALEDGNQGLALPVAADGAPRPRAPATAGARAGGVAGRDQGRRAAVGLRPPDAAPGGDDRRARAAARRGSPATPSGGWPATCSRRSSAASWPARSWRGGSSRSGSADGWRRSCVERPDDGRGSAAPARGALSARCATRPRRGWSRRPGR